MNKPAFFARLSAISPLGVVDFKVNAELAGYGQSVRPSVVLLHGTTRETIIRAVGRKGGENDAIGAWHRMRKAETKYRRWLKEWASNHLPTLHATYAKSFSVGDRVKVFRDNGETTYTTVTQLPWQLGHGAWVVGLKGFSGGYSLRRVSHLWFTDDSVAKCFTCKLPVEVCECAAVKPPGVTDEDQGRDRQADDTPVEAGAGRDDPPL